MSHQSFPRKRDLLGCRWEKAVLRQCVGFMRASPELSHTRIIAVWSGRILHHGEKMCSLMIVVGMKESPVSVKRDERSKIQWRCQESTFLEPVLREKNFSSESFRSQCRITTTRKEICSYSYTIWLCRFYLFMLMAQSKECINTWNIKRTL